MSDSDWARFLAADDEGRGPYIETVTGRKVHLLTPTIDEIHLADIAHALGNIARFNGHTRAVRPYSVAEHSLRVLRIVRRAYHHVAQRGVIARQTLATALLHDAHEAYIGDIATPVGRAIPRACGGCGFERSPVKLLKATLQRVIHEVFGLPWPVPEGLDALVHRADLQALAEERRLLLLDDGMDPMTPAEASGAFLSEAVNLLDLDVRLLDGWRPFDVRG